MLSRRSGADVVANSDSDRSDRESLGHWVSSRVEDTMSKNTPVRLSPSPRHVREQPASLAERLHQAVTVRIAAELRALSDQSPNDDGPYRWIRCVTVRAKKPFWDTAIHLNARLNARRLAQTTHVVVREHRVPSVCPVTPGRN